MNINTIDPRGLSALAAEFDADPFGAFPDDEPKNGRRGQGRSLGRASSPRASELADGVLKLHEIKPRTSRRYLVKGWIDRGALSVVYGESNVGKTFFALDLAAHIAAGIAWHGARVGKTEAHDGGQVLYVAGERGGGSGNRVEAMRLDRPELVTPCVGFSLLPMSLDLCLGDDAAALSEALGHMAAMPDLIVIDTLARAMGGGDENSGQDMGALIRNVDRLRADTGAHLMLIHHSGKDTTRGARGHSSLRAAADTEIELTRSGDVVMADAKKQRDIASIGQFAYRLRSVVVGTDEDGDEVSSAVVDPAEPVVRKPKISGQAKVAMQALDDALAQHGEKKTGELFPSNRNCVSVERWHEFCDRRQMSSGGSDSAQRKAFHTAKTLLQDKRFICIQDGFVWRVAE
jgi:hypothetical protein